MPYEVTNEQGVVAYFSQHCHEAGLEIEKIQSFYPDCIVYHKATDTHIRVEFEFQAYSFLIHRHDPSKCDLIVCWTKGEGDCGVPVMEMSKPEWVNYVPAMPSVHERRIAHLTHEVDRLTQIIKAHGLEPSVVLEPRDNTELELLGVTKDEVIEFVRVGDEVGFSQRLMRIRECPRSQYDKMVGALKQWGVLRGKPRSATKWARGWTLERFIREGPLA